MSGWKAGAAVIGTTPDEPVWLAGYAARTTPSRGVISPLHDKALALEDEVGSLVPGKRADIAIVALSGSPYLPWEDPAAAVVYGGAPERVARTYVDGEQRYEKGGFEWHELIAGGSAARGRMVSSARIAGAATQR